MQLVHGKTLTELIQKNGFALNKFFEIAIPLADAVAAAHEEGITHRDLKPDNVMAGDDGRIRVLDFGLAKPAAAAGFTGDRAGSEIPTAVKTEHGAVIGTLHYMSPEQAQGKPIDARSDIFSIGIVLYEMLTGNRPFGGDTPAGVLSSVIKDMPPPVAEARPEIPRELSKMVQRCLAKVPSRRLQSALDIRNELEELKADLSSGELGEVRPRGGPSSINKGLAAATVVLLLALLGALAYMNRSRDPSIPRLANAVQVTSAIGVEDYPSWSADGERVAYGFTEAGYFGGNWDIWVAQLGGGDPINLTADHAGQDRFPSWSPDGRQIAFMSDRDGAWRVYTMSSLGGNPRSLLSTASSAPGGGPQWSADGAELAISDRDADGNFVTIVTLPTLETRRVPLPEHEGRSCLDLRWSPDGRHFAYVEGGRADEITQLWVVASAGGEPTAVTDGFTNVWSPSWSADGSKLFFVSNRAGTMDLWQQHIGRDGKPEGEPEPVTSGLEIRSASFSPDGSKLAYTRGRWVTNLWRIPILSDRLATWADAEQMTSDNAFIQFVDVSPDGKRLVLSSDRAGNQDLWIVPSDGGVMTPLTTDPTSDWGPRWSPDGEEVVFWAYRSGNRDIWTMPAAGGPARQITTHPTYDVYPAWSHDGTQITFDSWRSGNPRHLDRRCEGRCASAADDGSRRRRHRRLVTGWALARLQDG